MFLKTEDGWRRRAHLVWEAANGPMPPGTLIHHDNEDELDDRLENLVLVTVSEHMRIHAGRRDMRAMGAKGLETRYGMG